MIKAEWVPPPNDCGSFLTDSTGADLACGNHSLVVGGVTLAELCTVPGKTVGFVDGSKVAWPKALPRTFAKQRAYLELLVLP